MVEVLPLALEENSLGLYIVAFVICSFSNMPAALREARRVLKLGGVFASLKSSKVYKYPLFNAVYKQRPFGAIPLIRQLVAVRDMIVDAGFVVAGKGYENLTGGVAAIHKGMKPL
ncbi:2-methoxy-6-polyprenyl-1,4-benzoquinol methylase, mitochondrial [Fusarium falciforme]|uniref:2-methoxy-6-polyprenyl-1,4-benzoquinol methylase, mitochondrial n=1 Tax=Fusarium falciforme TaxID=195108 RepID=UPI002301900B|nr:2-methoxy-6-polyprenyl-1,4-benzoquinol methylase, mitochondrial [Fusarium falciforme]WAO93380.1 2-methoxy-6-polyprenyl-1,4-benzoquinol methylase, mitochondrial [Fusarium falciforme]